MSRNVMDFAKAILNIRTALRISQQDLAAELDVSYATVNRWENGKSRPKGVFLRALEQFRAQAYRKEPA